jgi:hypothetical protein
MSAITVSYPGKAYKQLTPWMRLGRWLDPKNKPRHYQRWVPKTSISCLPCHGR